jgi:hypothetical protein
MLCNEEQRHFSYCCRDRARLLDSVAAVAIILNHLAQATHLTLDAL